MTASPPISKARLEALSDGIYAVVLTLLVLELKLPPLPEASGSALNAALLALLPKGLVWMLSFWVAALFWLAQGRVLAGMGVNIWDAMDPVRELVGSGRHVDPSRLRDLDVPLAEL